ncbi:MAG: kinase [Acidobacteriota bacterium]
MSLLPPLAPPALMLQMGHGSSIAHAGEILQGVFEASDNRLHRGLVTLPCVALESTATFEVTAGSGITVEPVWKTKAQASARLALSYLGLREVAGHLTVRSNIPPRWGFGSSTSDVIASIRAVAYAFRRRLAAHVVASLAVRAEIASDAVMFEDRAVLFAQREGIVLEDFGCGLPPMDVLVLNTDPSGNGVDTLLMPPAEYSPWEVEAFRPLRGLLRRALYTQDARLVGRVASASARINQRHLPKPRLDDLERLVEDLGGVGLQVAHSGCVVGLLFDSLVDAREERLAAAGARVAEWGFSTYARFQTREPEPIFEGALEL